MSKIKTKSKIDKNKALNTEQIHFTHLKFNFSFVNYTKGLTDIHKARILDRIMELSKYPYLVISNLGKKRGFEIVNLDIGIEIDPNFYEEPYRKFNKKYAVIRIYPNNNPLPSRLIGTIVNNIFYIFFIDINGTLYRH